MQEKRRDMYTKVMAAYVQNLPTRAATFSARSAKPGPCSPTILLRTQLLEAHIRSKFPAYALHNAEEDALPMLRSEPPSTQYAS